MRSTLIPLDMLFADGRGEIVRVHKYFDKNEKVHKRNFLAPDDTDFDNYLSYYPKGD